MSKDKMNNKNENKKRRKGSVTALIAGILVLALALGLGVTARLNQKTSVPEAAETPAQETIEPEMKPHLDGAQSFLQENTADKEEKETDQEKTPETAESVSETLEPAEEETSGGLVSYLPGSNSFSNGSGKISQGNSAQEYIEPEPIPTISFPYAIPNTELVVKQISPYTGYYLEDGSDRSVENIAAIVVTNNGDALDFAGIGIAQGENSYAFSASQIPAHSTVIIQEQTGAVLAEGDYHSCTATTTPSEGFQINSERVRITDNGDNTFSVSNLSEESIPTVKVYFKSYLPDEDVYVGGITYQVTLNDIEPNTAVEINSNHYASGYSVVVNIDIAE